MLKANIALELISGHDELDKYMSEILQGRTTEELERQAGILGKTVQNNAELAKVIPNASFHNATFSDRIWLNQALLNAELDKLLQSGLIRGENPRVLARELRKKVDTSIFNAERLMRTELARVQTEAQKQSFEANGFDEYEYIANSRCCDVCQALDGKHFKVKDMMPGENASPMHPHCRCAAAAHSDRKEYDEWLDFLANGGTTEEWNRLKNAKVDKSAKSGIIKLNRKANNNGAFASLPERMSKKHIRNLAKQYNVDLDGITISIDENEKMLERDFAGCAHSENIGKITFFAPAFRSKEELLRTLYHESTHVKQYRQYGVKYVQENINTFEQLTYDLEDKFIDELKERGEL